jgi:hypothetical protein
MFKKQIMNKKILYRLILLLNDTFGDYSVDEYYSDRSVYGEVSVFIQNDLGFSDSDEVDFIYASFYETLKKLNGNLSNFSENDVVVPIKYKFRGERSYFAEVRYNEIYNYDTYLPVILEYMIDEYIIDEEKLETDIRDTWGHETEIVKVK